MAIACAHAVITSGIHRWFVLKVTDQVHVKSAENIEKEVRWIWHKTAFYHFVLPLILLFVLSEEKVLFQLGDCQSVKHDEINRSLLGMTSFPCNSWCQ
jgi:hypothetical protein